MIRLYESDHGEWFTSRRQAEDIGFTVTEESFDAESLCMFLNYLTGQLLKYEPHRFSGDIINDDT